MRKNKREIPRPKQLVSQTSTVIMNKGNKTGIQFLIIKLFLFLLNFCFEKAALCLTDLLSIRDRASEKKATPQREMINFIQICTIMDDVHQPAFSFTFSRLTGCKCFVFGFVRFENDSKSQNFYLFF